MKSCNIRGLAILLAAVFLAGTSLHAQRVAEAFQPILNPAGVSFQTLLNNSANVQFWNLKTSGVFPNGALYDLQSVGNGLDNGFILVANFGNSNPVTPTMPFNFPQELPPAPAAVYAVSPDGYLQLARVTNTGGQTVFVGPTGTLAELGHYGNSVLRSIIAGFSEDLTFFSTGTTVDPNANWYLAEQGTTPNRRLVIEWNNVLIKNTSARVTFQIAINENGGNQTIDIIFGTLNGTLPAGRAFLTGLNEGTGNAWATGPATPKGTDGQPGNFIASVFNGTSWTHDFGTGGGNIGSTAFPANQVLRYCKAPILAPQPSTDPIFNAAVNPNDRVPFGGQSITRDYVITNPSGNNHGAAKIVAEIVPGDNAAAYSVTPAPGSNPNNVNPGSSTTFRVTFNPNLVLGDAPAQLRVLISTPDGATCPTARQPVTVPLNARSSALTMIADTIDFGVIAPGTPEVISRVVYRNDALVPINFDFASVSGGEGTFSIVQPSSGVVQPGQSIELNVAFSPRRAIVYNANANLFFNAPRQGGGTVNGVLQFPLKGEGIQPRMKIFNPLNPADSGHFANGSVLALRQESIVGEEFHTVNMRVTNTGSDAYFLSNFRFLKLLAGEPTIDNPLPRPCPQALDDFTNEFKVSYFNKQTNSYQQVALGDPGSTIRVQLNDTVDIRVEYTPDRPGTMLSYRMFADAYATEYELIDHLNDFVESPDACGIVQQELINYNFINMSARGARTLGIGNVNFGEVGLGAEAIRNVRIRNTGDAALFIDPAQTRFSAGDVNDFAIIEDGFDGFTEEGGRMRLEPASEGNIRVRFSPTRLGTRFATLLLQTNDFLSDENGVIDGTRRVSLTGRGIEGATITLAGEDSEVPFADDLAVVGDEATFVTRNVAVENAGTGVLRISQMTLEGANAADYRIVTNDVTEVAPGATVFISIRFAPQTQGSKSANFVVRSNASNSPVASIRLAGTAGTRTLTASEGSLFEGVRIAAGETASDNFTIQNTGTVGIEVQLSLTNINDYRLLGETTFELAAGASRVVEVELVSQIRGDKSGTVLVENNSTNQPFVEYQLLGNVGMRSFTLSQDLISINTELINGRYVERDICIELTNTGDFDLDIASVVFEGADAAEFEIDGTVPASVPVGGTVNLCFTYKPTKANASAELVVRTNALVAEQRVIINGTVTSVRDIQAKEGFSVESVFPNPTHSEAVFRFSVASHETVTVEVFQASGAKVATPVNQKPYMAGTHEVRFDVRNLPSGSYFIKVSVPGGSYVNSLRVVR